jgi:hypothetical protein
VLGRHEVTGSTPVSSTYLDSKVRAALRELEDAEAALDAIYEQGFAVRALQAGYLSLAPETAVPSHNPS